MAIQSEASKLSELRETLVMDDTVHSSFILWFMLCPLFLSSFSSSARRPYHFPSSLVAPSMRIHAAGLSTSGSTAHPFCLRPEGGSHEPLLPSSSPGTHSMPELAERERRLGKYVRIPASLRLHRSVSMARSL